MAQAKPSTDWKRATAESNPWFMQRANCWPSDSSYTHGQPTVKMFKKKLKKILTEATTRLTSISRLESSLRENHWSWRWTSPLWTPSRGNHYDSEGDSFISMTIHVKTLNRKLVKMVRKAWTFPFLKMLHAKSSFYQDISSGIKTAPHTVRSCSTTFFPPQRKTVLTMGTNHLFSAQY